MNKIVYFLLIFNSVVFGQVQQLDTTPLQLDTILSSESGDSLVLRGTALYVASKDSIKDPVDYGAIDRVNFDYAKKIIHLYGDAYLRYQTMEIKADYIKIDMNTNIATAIPKIDSSGKKIGVPRFKDGEQNFDAQKLDYNFKTKKGIISEIVSKEQDIYIHGKVTKFISKDNPETHGDDVIYSKDAIFTTCNHPDPHFGIFSRKQKVIPNKLVIVGPSKVVIKGIPTPLQLPFGFFPISKDRQGGLIFPKNYTYQDALGFGLEDIGYYWPINQHMDVKLLSKIYFKGSWGIKADGNYRKKYKYNGGFLIDFENLIREDFNVIGTRINRPIRLRWNHNQDQAAHPYQSFGGSMDIQTNGYNRSVNIYSTNVLDNTLNSNLTYNRIITNSPFSLNASFRHFQNLRTKAVEIILPSLSINMRTVNPFKNNNRVTNEERWYDKISVNYNSRAINKLNTTDTALFTKKSLEDLQYGIVHNASADVSFRVFKYFNLVPSINYKEEWFFQKQDKHFDPSEFIDSVIVKTKEGGDSTVYDTTKGRIITQYTKGFSSLRELSASASLNTRIYSQLQLKKGWLKGIRHEMSPSVSLSYAPNYHNKPFNYFKSVQSDTTGTNFEEYLIYAKSPFGTSGVQTENFVINFGLTQRIDMKYKNKRDSLSKKLNLIEGFSMNASYNVFKDTMKLSAISAGGSNRFFKGMTTVNYNFNFNPYARKIVDGKEIYSNEYAYKVEKKLAHLHQAGITISTGANVGQLRDIFGFKGDANKPKDQLPSIYGVISGFYFSHSIGFNVYRLNSGKDTASITHNSLSMNGSIPLTSKWKITLDHITYDFASKNIVYPSLTIERDLHCWYMNLRWSPEAGAFSFFIGVKPGSFEFLKIPNSKAFNGAQPL